MTSLPLHVRVTLINGLVFVTGAAVFALSPATLSQTLILREALVMGVGLVLITAINAILLRGVLTPVDQLVEELATVDLARPGERLPVRGRGTSATLAASYNGLLDRLDEERRDRTLRTLAGQEAERQRLGRELHDEVGQSLTAILLGLASLSPHVRQDGQDELRLLQETTRSGLDELRRISRALRPSALDDLGLHGSLGALAADFTASTRIPVNRSTSPAIGELPRDVEVVVYRVAQEALTNVSRHAHANSVELTLVRAEHWVELTVSDDGIGLRDRPEGTGIQGMRERALLVGGELTLERAGAGGTRVRLVVPVDEGES